MVAERRWSVADVYVDNDRSASKKGTSRPAYERMLADIEAGKIEAVVVWNMDRLTRQPRQLEAFVDLCEDVGMTKFATVSGDVDLATADGVMMARITGAFAAGEVRKLRDRLRRKALEVAESGKPWGGHRPIGFADNRVDHNPVEAEAIRRAAAMILDGATLMAAAEPLREIGAVSPRRDNSSRTLKRILTSPRIAGLREYRGEIISKATWEPIIGRADWERLRTILLRPGRYSVSSRQHLLTGFVRCTCGSKLSVHVRNHEGGRVIYSCRTARGGCGHVGVDGRRLEEHVSAEVASWLDSPAMHRALQRRSDDTDDREVDLLAALAEDERLLNDLARQVGELKASVSEWSTMRQPIVDRIDATRAELVRTVPASPSLITIEHLQRLWQSAESDKRREAMRVMGVTVVVAPVGKAARRFQSERVKVTPGWIQSSMSTSSSSPDS